MSENAKQNNSSIPAPIDPPPDGGLHAWMTVAGSFCAVFVQFGLANSFGVFQSFYEEDLLSDYTSSDISWIGALQQFLLFFGGLFVGRIFDGHGAHILLIPGAFALVLSLMLLSLCKQYYQFALCQGVLFGIGSSLIFSPALAAPGQWFAKRRALAMAVTVSGSGIGGTLWPIALRRMIDEMGFPWAIRTTGFISLFLLAVAGLLIRTRLRRKKPAPWVALARPLREARFTLLSFSVAFVFWGMFTPFFFATTYAARFTNSTSLAFYCLSFINAGSSCGRLLAAIGDRVGRFNLYIISSLMCGIFLLGFWIPLNSMAALIAFCVVYGLSAGILISLIPACVAQISIPQEIGLRVGVLWTVVSLFALSGPPINGVLIARYEGVKGYQMAGVFSGVVVLVGCALGLFSRISINKKIVAVV